MYIRRNFTFKGVFQFSGFHLIWLIAWSTISVTLFHVLNWTWLSIPWLPISLIGIAVAFYVGFKNNASYNRMWEARQIWGAIVNDSRSWGIACKNYITNIFREEKIDKDQLKALVQRLIYRHIAWLYTLRKQLLVTAPWEHLNASYGIRKINERRIKFYGTGVLDEEDYEVTMGKLLDNEDIEVVQKAANGATQLLDRQATALLELREQNIIEDFRHIDMQQLLYRFFGHQGKCERIKNYPFPRQYASLSFVFIAIFIILLPFGLMPEFLKLGSGLIWLTIPFTTLVGWVFLMMELVGDYSENPFEGLGNDIPMMSLCRTIEIDLREMLGESDLPPKIQAKNHVLM